MSEQLASTSSITGEEQVIESPKINYDAELDEVLKLYEDAVDKELVYILNTTFQLKNTDSLLYVQCGLSPARCFEPAVKIINKINPSGAYHISFDATEWAEFIRIINQVSKECDDVTPLTVIECGEEIKLIRCSYQQNVKMFIISKYSTYFHVTEADLRELIEMDSLISKRIDMLNHLNFNRYYVNFIDIVNNILAHSVYTLDPVDVISAFCCISNSLESYCIQECIYYIKDKFLNDIERKKYY